MTWIKSHLGLLALAAAFLLMGLVEGADGHEPIRRGPVTDGWASVAVVTRADARAYAEADEAIRAARAAAALSPAVENAGYSYSGSVWDAVAACEAWGDWSYVGPSAGGYYFVLQFHPQTWLAYGGTQAELDAGVAPSRARLIEVAERVLADQGPNAWPNCFPS